MKYLFSLFLFLGFTGSLFAQVPQAFSYQAVARDAAGICIQNQEISIRISILDSIASGPTLYTEFHTDTTNDQGLFSVEIGRGDVLAGTYDELGEIPWSSNPKFLQVEMDPMGGNNYQLVGTSELLSVPYAMQAQEAQNLAPEIPVNLTVSAGGTNITASLIEQWTFDENDHTYALYSLSATTNWIVANDFCRKAKGHMITITSGSENQFVFSNILSMTEAQGHIPLGLTDALTENRFDWITGEIGFDQAAAGKKIYRNWNAGEPNNAQDLEHYCHIISTIGSSQRLWNDLRGNLDFFNAIIVEYDNGIISP